LKIFNILSLFFKEFAEEFKEFSEPYVTITDEDIIVDENHPEIAASVEKAVAEAVKQAISLPASEYIDVLSEEIKRVQEDRQKNDPTASRYSLPV
jgi:hypothetical protein